MYKNNKCNKTDQVSISSSIGNGGISHLLNIAASTPVDRLTGCYNHWKITGVNSHVLDVI